MASQTFQLVMHSGPTPGKIFELVQDELTIGRDIGNRIVIERSRSLAQARPHDHAVRRLCDRGPRLDNGTFVNNQRLIGPHMLRPAKPSCWRKDRSGNRILGLRSGCHHGEQWRPPTSRPCPFTAKLTALRRPTLATRRFLRQLSRPSNPGYYQPPAPAYPPPAPVFSGQVPPGPSEPQSRPAGAIESPSPRKRRQKSPAPGCMWVVAAW